MPERLTPDICVIGAGSAGLTVAAAAVAFGVDVVLVERGRMGGDCLNYGCVPSKALIAAAGHAKAIDESAAFGIDVAGRSVDFARVHDHVHAVIASISPNDSAERFEAMGVRVIQETAAFRDRRTVIAGDFEIRARRFVIATGSRPAVPAIEGIDDVDYLTNEKVFDLKERPEHLIVVGAGPIGLEMAQAHRRLGSAVTVIEAASALSGDDPEMAAIVVDGLRGEGVILHEKTAISRIESDGGVRLHCERDGNRFEISGTALLLATGRTPNIDALDLEAAGINYNKRGVAVGDNLRSSNRRVYAIGDVAGRLQFTHVAGYHAGLVVQQILFRVPARIKHAILPWVTYTDPELAHVGLSETEARRHHADVRVLRWPMAENDRARAERRTEGAIKLVTTTKGRIVGVTIAGAGAGDLIGLWALAVAKGMSVGDIRGYVAPYPTRGEIGKRAALTYYDTVPRKPSVRKLVRWLARFG